MTLSPLTTILSQNRLTGENYVDWKRNLDIVLTVDGHKYVLTTPCPPKPSNDSTQEEKDAYKAWLRSDEVARCYILASVNNVLQQQHRDIDNAADMIYSITEMFGAQGRQARQAAVRQFMNCRMRPGTPVREHMMTIMGHLNEMEIMGAEIDGDTKVDMILETLTDSFDNFKLNYSMNKLDYSLPELIKELQAAETILHKGKNKVGEANHTSGRASTSGTKKDQSRGSKRKASKPAPAAEKGKVAKADKTEDLCHHCKKPGHWRRNCPAYLKEIKNKGSLFYYLASLSD